jgi:hypothetical protein
MQQVPVRGPAAMPAIGLRAFAGEDEAVGNIDRHERRSPAVPAVVALAMFGLTACATQTTVAPVAPAPAQQGFPPLPPTIAAEEVVGRWGFASYHKDEDRPRTEKAASGQCRQPYVITRGSAGGVVMHLADNPTPQELRLKGGPGGKNYIGPAGNAAGPQDREFVAFDGRVMVLRWIDPEVASRYGTAVYVRCSPRA